MPDAVGDRIYEIRRALGPSPRQELSLRDFAERLTVVAGELAARGVIPEPIRYHASELSRMERGQRGVSLFDVEVLAAIDPAQRGRGWLAFGDAASESAPAADLRSIPGVEVRTADEEAAQLAREAAAAARARRRGSA